MQMKMFNKSFWKIRKKKKYAVTPNPTMISPGGTKTPIKMAGYLEKKSKMRVVCRWKKLWFVLEGRLLLYYKSQIEYLSLSPCRGTVNMGLAASVLPGKNNEIIVSTRSHTVSLRALSRSDHDIWLQALMDAMCMPNSSHALCCTKPVHHFRYSTGGLDHGADKNHIGYSIVNHANTISTGQLSPLYIKTSQNLNSSGPSISTKSKPKIARESILDHNSPDLVRRGNTLQNYVIRTGNEREARDYKIDKLGKKFSKVAVSDTSIPGRFKVTSNENLRASLLRRSLSVEEEVNRYSENIYESLKDVNKFESNVISKQTRKYVTRVNRSDSDCLMMIAREKINKTHPHQFRSEQRIKTSGNSPLPIYERFSETFYCRKPERQTGDAMEKMWKLKMKYNGIPKQNFEKEAKSDTDLSLRKHHSGIEERRNYGALYRSSVLSKRNSESYDFSNLQQIIKEKTRAPIPLPGALRPSKTSRSNSILRTLSRIKPPEKSSNDLVKRNSMKKRSLSFLKKIWKRKDTTKWEEDSFSTEINNYHEMQGPSSDFDNMSDFSTNDLSEGYDVPQPEPPPDYDQVNVTDDEECKVPPELPPRFHHTAVVLPSHDVPLNKKLVDTEPPALPVKVRKLPKKNSNALDFLFYENSDPGLRYLFQEEEYVQENGKENSDKDLGEILTKLNEMNNAPLASFHLYENGKDSFGAQRHKNDEDPDYDIPRPHVSLLSNLRKQSCVSDSLPATNFFSHYEDSLDVTTVRDRYEEFTMAPDSLECDPWSLSNEAEVQSESWSLNCDFHDQRKSISDNNLNQDSLYQDSLNPPISHRLNDYIHLQAGYIQLHS